MKVRTLCAVAITSALLVGCGHTGNDSANRQAAIASQELPSSIADKPAQLQLPHWQNRVNPHFDVRNKNGQVIFYSDDKLWNGHIMNLYYVPRDNVVVDNGEYSLRSTAPLQRIATTHMEKDQTWSVAWNIKGHELPKVFYVLARTDVNQTTIEKVTWHQHALRISGGDSPVQ
ncbi:hypothetical protein [Alicyclobacillus acidoterrestris]|uniref:Lipoprotein n=1 Tax=Alicyclobacillus acidoterrestris (strain ATCC 49025 / DSM 3922 / CIP 106132 / NCIMB 13137 / GD3B) TaxID=1356854 RepID=A0A9E6ZF04_ALIAG|nr:hypothetical protein [Alicyclobacillus acidoterrestris]UNO47462.1 hypothetical protein K1I37_12150 [Alicyclobacillus acidoterrestris]